MLQQHTYIDFNEIVLSFQGIGEPSLVAAQVADATAALLKVLPKNSTVSIATTCVNLNAFTIWKESGIKWKNLQVSITDYSVRDFLQIQNIIHYLDGNKISDLFSKIKFNYILIHELNDSKKHLNRLISLFNNTKYTIKLSKLNSCNINLQLTSSTVERFNYFSSELSKHQINNYIFGAEINSEISCGQLVYLNHQYHG